MFYLVIDESSHITGFPVYKDGNNQKQDFENSIRLNNKNWKRKLDGYIEFFKELPVAAKTENGVFICHAGPSININNIEEVINITNPGYYGNTGLSNLLWDRPEDFTERGLNSFLRSVGCKYSIVGHTPIDGFEIVYQKQMIVSSSFSTGRKAYLELDLKKELENMEDIVKMVKYLE